MPSMLRRMEGLKIKSVHPSEPGGFEGISLMFEPQGAIGIFNPSRILPEGRFRLEDLRGQTIDRVVDVKDDCVRIHFSNGAVIFIDIRPEAFRGPEALDLGLPDGSCIIMREGDWEDLQED